MTMCLHQSTKQLRNGSDFLETRLDCCYLLQMVAITLVVQDAELLEARRVIKSQQDELKVGSDERMKMLEAHNAQLTFEVDTLKRELQRVCLSLHVDNH